MSTSQTRGTYRMLGIVGAVLLVSGLNTAFFITGRFGDPWAWVQLALGGLLLATYLFTNLSNLSDEFSGRGSVFFVSSIVSGVVLAGALGAVNYIAFKKPKTWDLTKDQVFSLSDQTVSLLKGLPSEVQVLAFVAPSEPEYNALDSQLRQYKEHTDKLKVTFLDPAKHLEEVKQYNIAAGGPRIIVKAGAKESRTKDLGEEALTNAIAEVTRGEAKKVYFSKGHGERSITDQSERGMKLYVDALKSEGFVIDEILLSEHKEMPTDCKVLLIVGPVASLQQGELALVQAWVEKGGKLIVMIDPNQSSGLEGLLATLGITAGNNVVIDADSQQPEVAMGTQYEKHPITEPKTSAFAMPTLFPLARSMSKGGRAGPSNPWELTEIVKTGQRAWGEVDPIQGKEISFDPARDLKGPVPMVVVGTKGTGDAQSRLVAIGNSAFVANGFFRLYGNKDLALNAVAWAAGDEAKISIRAKSRQSNQLFLSADQQHKISIFAFDLLPFSLLLAGLLVWQTRKSR
ncbi:MAG: GldG family protein [Deltaproteobacteria bacterium]|nr:GldG family protein [Deltaproteobacteria bacterium]